MGQDLKWASLGFLHLIHVEATGYRGSASSWLLHSRVWHVWPLFLSWDSISYFRASPSNLILTAWKSQGGLTSYMTASQECSKTPGWKLKHFYKLALEMPKYPFHTFYWSSRPAQI